MWNKITSFYNQELSSIDRAILVLTGVSLLIGGVYIVGNALFTHYEGNWFSPPSWIIGSPFMVLFAVLGVFCRGFMPRTGFIVRGLGLFFLIATVQQAAIAYGLQFTPFPTIDSTLIRWDTWLGFDTIGALNWAYAHPNFQSFLDFAYNSLIIELVALPLLLSVLQLQRGVDGFYLTVLISFLIGTTIYYFFPSIAPAGMFHSPHFTESQLATSLKFFQIHYSLPITTSDGGLIAFPSFHVIWAVLLVYACKDSKWLLYPMLLWNLFIIASTVLLGWHYLVDAISGVMIALLTIYIVEKILGRYAQYSQTSILPAINWASLIKSMKPKKLFWGFTHYKLAKILSRIHE